MPKALIVEAVCEGAGAQAVGQILVSKKEVMVADAEQLLAGTSWLPFYPTSFGGESSRGLWRHRQPGRYGNAERC